MIPTRWVLIAIAVVAALLAAFGVGYWGGRQFTTRSAPGYLLSVPRATAAALPPAADPASPDTVAKNVLAAADRAASQARWLEARQLYQQVLHEYPDTPAAVQAQQQVGTINIRLLLAPSPDPNAPFYTAYTVQPGDTLGRIARQFHTTIELLQRANRLTGAKILVGRPLKVPTVTFSVVVDKSQNTLTLKADEEVIKVYSVSTGKEDQTPVGTFTIVNKLEHPTWYTAQGAAIPPGSPENILGTRWLGFSKPGYGIHGTTDPATIGQPVTAGCVRMRNEDVEELYALLPLATDVTIVD